MQNEGVRGLGTTIKKVSGVLRSLRVSFGRLRFLQVKSLKTFLQVKSLETFPAMLSLCK